MKTTKTKSTATRRPGNTGGTMDWIATLMRHEPEFTLTIKTEGRQLHEVQLSPNVIRQLATDTQALRTLGPIVREKWAETTTAQRRVA